MCVFGGALRRALTACQSSALLCARLFSAGSCARIRMHAVPKLRELDRWTEKRSMFGVYDNIGILGKRIQT
ncbi:39S ribosomal protein L51, mitochondrial-like [Sinocyclocheilus grahami]|uniref:39S ribosomal protein L51, mitochondrial-like n=1 Tax=Sinocyclocheilus grahami TaxID=75366 RepID=UPI0007ACE571|nr:PREDICTED: 39S ribosomal protein L51, mitochondrial-like [Sinocyclocheilus grahami]